MLWIEHFWSSKETSCDPRGEDREEVLEVRGERGVQASQRLQAVYVDNSQKTKSELRFDQVRRDKLSVQGSDCKGES